MSNSFQSYRDKSTAKPVSVEFSGENKPVAYHYVSLKELKTGKIGNKHTKQHLNVVLKVLIPWYPINIGLGISSTYLLRASLKLINLLEELDVTGDTSVSKQDLEYLQTTLIQANQNLATVIVGLESLNQRYGGG